MLRKVEPNTAALLTAYIVVLYGAVMCLALMQGILRRIVAWFCTRSIPSHTRN